MIEELLEILLESNRQPTNQPFPSPRESQGLPELVPQDNSQNFPSGGNSSPWGDLLEIFLEGALGGNESVPEQRQGGWGNPQEIEQFPSQPMPRDEPSSGGGILSGGLGMLLELFLGGGKRNNVGANPLLAPITNALAERLNISPQMASIIVSFAVSLIVERVRNGGGVSSDDAGNRTPSGGLDLDDLLDSDFLMSQRVTEQLAEQTGLDEEEAAQSLREAMVLLNGGQLAEKEEPVTRRDAGSDENIDASELGHLLDTWETD
ncbi:MAG: hypothetical protein AAF639_23905 [Chloroflexota bacterium]